MKRRFRSKATDFRKVLFKKTDQTNWPSGKFECKIINVSKIVRIMKKVNLDVVEIDPKARRHWDGLIESEHKLVDNIIRIYIDRTFNELEPDDHISDDMSSSSGSPLPEEDILIKAKPPLKDDNGEIACVNLYVIQAIMRLPVIQKQDDVVLQDLNPLEGPAEWICLRKCTLGNEKNIVFN